jgi:iron complex transport system ATP-binding protein
VTALSVQALGWRYHQQTVIKDISFSIPAGSFVAFLGKNGSGKSTLLRCLAGILPIPAGTVFIAGVDLGKTSYVERAKLIGYLPQFHDPVFPFAVEEVVLTGRTAQVFLTPSTEDYEKARQALKVVGIEHLSHRPYTELSGGERQLVMIARIIAQSPRVILLDEPLSHLDLCNQIHLLNLLRRLADDGNTIAAVMHDPTLALNYCDHHIFLKNGGLHWPPRDTNLYEAFLSEVFNTSLRLIHYQGRSIVIPA